MITREGSSELIKTLHFVGLVQYFFLFFVVWTRIHKAAEYASFFLDPDKHFNKYLIILLLKRFFLWPASRADTASLDKSVLTFKRFMNRYGTPP